MPTIENAPSGADSSVDETEKIPVSGSKYMLLSVLIEYIRTAVKTFTNKTLDNTNTITVKDTLFTIQDDGDATKQAKFQASSITAGQTRTLTVPDTSSTIAVTGNKLSAFASTTSSELAGVISDETGSGGALVFASSPTITTPTIASFANATHSHADAAGGGLIPTFKTIAVSGQSDVVADSVTDTLTLAEGSNITITTNATTDTITIAASGGGAVATDTIWDAKGDLAVGTGANTAAKLTVGTNGYVLSADSGEATGLKWIAATGTIGGSTGATDNAIIRADGTGGATLQNSAVTIDDSGTVNIPSGQTYNINGSAHSHQTFTDYSASSTISGWAATPTATILVQKVGRLVNVSFSITGTSNSTSSSFTVPDANNSTFAPIIPIGVTDNGSSQAAAGRIRLATGSATVALDKALNASNGWTASGTKTISGSFSYMTD